MVRLVTAARLDGEAARERVGLKELGQRGGDEVAEGVRLPKAHAHATARAGEAGAGGEQEGARELRRWHGWIVGTWERGRTFAWRLLFEQHDLRSKEVRRVLLP